MSPVISVRLWNFKDAVFHQKSKWGTTFPDMDAHFRHFLIENSILKIFGSMDVKITNQSWIDQCEIFLSDSNASS